LSRGRECASRVKSNPAAWGECRDQHRGFYGHIEAALKRNVTLKVIHQRLNDAGIPISYKLLSVYVSRMQQGHHAEELQPIEN